ncbi:MAG: tetratricopeptide repeat protein [Bacteroidales bacterium]|nr:tetratricopeptide repeat protein [Bacteroidales bacterium]
MKKGVVLFLLLVFAAPALLYAQPDKRDVRAGNRKFRKEQYREAEIDYRKALLKDSLSVAAAYDLASALYRQQDYAGAEKAMAPVKKLVPGTPHEADYHFNAGDIALQKRDYAAAVAAFRQSLLRNPGDIAAKENYLYAKKMLQNQQNKQDPQEQQDGGDKQDQQNPEQDQQNQQDPQQQPDENREQDGEQQQEGGISRQQAQQMLQAIQAKEQETQDKVKKEKAEALSSRRKEKNW